MNRFFAFSLAVARLGAAAFVGLAYLAPAPGAAASEGPGPAAVATSAGLQETGPAVGAPDQAPEAAPRPVPRRTPGARRGAAEAPLTRRFFPPGPPLDPVPVVAATDRYVYVLRGDTLTSFDARTLRQVARVTLPAPELRRLDPPVPRPERLAPPSSEGAPLPGAPRAPRPPEPPRAAPAPGGASPFPGENAPYTPGPPPVRPSPGSRAPLPPAPPTAFRLPGPPPEPPAALTATGRSVYVARGEMLYAFDAVTLKEVARARLTDAEAQPPRAGAQRP